MAAICLSQDLLCNPRSANFLLVLQYAMHVDDTLFRWQHSRTFCKPTKSGKVKMLINVGM